MSGLATALGGVALLVWLYLLAFRDGFWRADQRLDAPPASAAALPSVVAIVPARDEADVVGVSIASLLGQRGVPSLRVILVDDESGDGTAAAARASAARMDASDRLEVLQGAPRPPGWTGKMWAIAQGVAAAQRLGPRYFLLADADIAHDPDAVHALVAKAEHEGRHLVSLMVRLNCRSGIERLLVPAFVFFFQKLYPFPAVNDPKRRIAAAAGGCMLVRADALARSGGIAAVRGALIDDCALARRIKDGGAIWLGLATKSASLRPYPGLGAFWRMVARTAYTQLRHSPGLLAGGIVAMALTYLAAPAAVALGLAGDAWPAVPLGGAAWIAMAVAYAPTLRLYSLSPLWAAALPASGLLYTLMTLDSAWRHWRGRGGEWKGRWRGGITDGLERARGPR